MHLVSRIAVCLWFFLPAFTLAQAPVSGLDFYKELKQFQLGGGSIRVDNLVLNRDRLAMTLDGVVYFQKPVQGRIHGAVFLGRGMFRSEVPPSAFEKDHVKRMLKADVIESDFRTAVFRFSDDTVEALGGTKGAVDAAPEEAVKLAAAFEPKFLRETGANVSARLAVSILNAERPGFFVAQFDQGRRNRFTALIDHQGRIPMAAFTINGGEKGMIFANEGHGNGNEIWTAFYSQEDYKRGTVQYSDAHDLLHIPNYVMKVDVRDPKKVLKLEARLDCQANVEGLRAAPLVLSESLPEYDSIRLKKAMRLKAANWADGKPLDVVQEDWEGGLTVFLPEAHPTGSKFSVVLKTEGDFMYDSPNIPEVFYPLVSGDWYPRHGYLQRSTFDLTFVHKKQFRVAASGLRLKEEASGDSEMITQWKMDRPVALVTFGVGRFERHGETVNRKEGSPLPVEFYSLPGSHLAIKEDFIVAELMNSVNYFSAIFGPYPYAKFGAVYHPRGYGQGFASLLLLPKSDTANKYTYSFIAHETAHQWWGNIVAWRSYRDQWLSEGFAEYSGVLYTMLRDKKNSWRELVEDMRRSMRDPPATEQGIGKGRLVDVGPLILGHRLRSRESLNAYGTLIYEKGALVLRMLHFLLTDPATGDGKAFIEMMSDFVSRHKDGWATTDTFQDVAAEHVARSPVGRKYGIKDLNWFFQQWVYQTHLPSYKMAYKVEKQADGSVLLTGNIHQDNAPKEWFMPLPVMMKFGKDQIAVGTVHALGPVTPFKIKLPAIPESVELDPQMWILSEKTNTERMK